MAPARPDLAARPPQPHDASTGYAGRLRSAGLAPPAWQLEAGGDGFWLVATPAGSGLPAQGWKLHLSATVHTAHDLLAAALPVLAAERAAFKVARRPEALAALNEGAEGLSQVGKFVTVYPVDDAAAVRLAGALDAATHGLAGPAVPSDRRLRAGSAVHYRYGGFDGRVLQLPYGEVVPAIAAPDGTLVPDRRAAVYSAPEGVTDPFVAAGLATPEQGRALVVAGRFVLGALLHHTPRGRVFLALDLEAGRRAVVKQAGRGAAVSADGRDARDQLANELAALESLRDDPRFPEPYALVEQDDDVFLAMEDVPGRTLGEHLRERRARGAFLEPGRIRGWGIAVAEAVATMHERGLVHRDVKPTNVIVTPGGELRLIDLELAHGVGDTRPPAGLGTPGYMSPSQAAGGPPVPADDVYGLGALLYLLATGADPGQTPARRALSDRAPRALNPGLPRWLEDVILRCLDEDAATRIGSAREVSAALSRGALAGARPRRAPRSAAADPAALAAALTAGLVADARPAPDGPGLVWPSRRYAATGAAVRDLNTGAAGVVLALAELAGRDDHGALAALAGGADWLASTPVAAATAPGLYVGEAGVAVALLAAGRRLGRDALVESALARLGAVAREPFVSPDLFNGTAGRLTAHLLALDATGDARQLAAARACGEALLAAAEDTAGGGVAWRIPDGYGGLSGIAHTGYSHGTAGIADALLRLAEATGEAAYRVAARRAADSLVRLALPAAAGTGLEWPVAEGGEPLGPFWCHGAGGIARFFLHAARHDLVPGAARIAAAAVQTVVTGGRACGPTRCHGLAGSIELLLDVERETGDASHRAEAGSLAGLLRAFLVDRDGLLRSCSDDPDAVEPGLMVGTAGVALALARLADPAVRHAPALSCRLPGRL